MKLKIQKVEGIFRSIVLSKFIKQLFLLIKPGLSESFLYVLFFLIKKKLNYSPIFLFFEIIDKIRPKIGLKFFRRYKFNELETFVVPYLLTTYFQYNRAIFWFVKVIQSRKESCLILKIFSEFSIILFKQAGECLNKKKEYYEQVIVSKSTKKFKW